MYEEKKFKLNINWKAMLLKLGILLLVVFIICLIVFKPKTNKVVSLITNINTIKKASLNYYKENLNIDEIDEYQEVTLKELINNHYIKKQKDLKNNSCDSNNSFAHLTKINDDEFSLKINVKCGKNSDSKTYNIKSDELIIKNDKEELKEEIILEEEKPVEEVKPEVKPDIKEDKESSSSTTHIDFSNDELIEELKDPNSNKVVRYKHIKYGEWQEGTKEGLNIEKATKNVHYYNYCNESNCEIDTIENSYLYEGYSKTYSHTEKIDIYRYVYVVWSNSSCVKGFINTGITELR